MKVKKNFLCEMVHNAWINKGQVDNIAKAGSSVQNFL